MFAHYAYWIPSFLDKVHPLTTDIATADDISVDPSVPLVVKTGTSDCATAASLKQSGRPVAFFQDSHDPNGDTQQLKKRLTPLLRY